jgi:hypothetical protein
MLLGVLPSMETSGFNAPAQFIQAGDVGPIPRCDTSTLGSYLGLSDIADTSSGGAPPGVTGKPKESLEFNLDALMLSTLASGPSMTGAVPVKRTGSTTSMQSSDTDITTTPGTGTAAVRVVLGEQVLKRYKLSLCLPSLRPPLDLDLNPLAKTPNRTNHV